MPIYEGSCNRPYLYLDCELEVNEIVASHFRDHKKVWVVFSTFSDLAST
jgi:hypothetical protein